MTTDQVLREIPGLTRELLYSWEAQGYISSHKESIGEKGYNRRHWSLKVVDKLKKMFDYYNQGMAPRKASEKANREISKGPGLFDSL